MPDQNTNDADAYPYIVRLSYDIFVLNVWGCESKKSVDSFCLWVYTTGCEGPEVGTQGEDKRRLDHETLRGHRVQVDQPDHKD